MTTNQLKYFITAAETLNFTEAGRIHFISQTAITQHIQSLEQQLGVTLFIRRKRHVELTEAGKVFLNEARAILNRTSLAVERAKRTASGYGGNINAGYVKGLEGSSGLHRFISAFTKDVPEISLQLFRDNNLDLLLKLKTGDLDFAFAVCYENTDTTGFCTIDITSYPLYAALYPGHPLSGRSSIRRIELKKDDFFLSRFYDDPTAKDFVLPEKYAHSGFIPKVVGRSKDIETLLLLVNAGLGITVVPEPSISYVNRELDISFVPLEGEHEHVVVKGLYREDDVHPALITMTDYLRKEALSFFR